jgi:hypothetical protein
MLNIVTPYGEYSMSKDTVIRLVWEHLQEQRELAALREFVLGCTDRLYDIENNAEFLIQVIQYHRPKQSLALGTSPLYPHSHPSDP